MNPSWKLPTLVEAHAEIISLILARAEMLEDRYADLRSQARTSAARDLIFRVYDDIADWEQQTGKRVRRRRARRGVVFVDAVERFVGDLLRSRTGANASGRVYRALGETKFNDARELRRVQERA